MVRHCKRRKNEFLSFYTPNTPKNYVFRVEFLDFDIKNEFFIVFYPYFNQNMTKIPTFEGFKVLGVDLRGWIYENTKFSCFSQFLISFQLIVGFLRFFTACKKEKPPVRVEPWLVFWGNGEQWKIPLSQLVIF